jgi:hypothetical protein
MLAVGLAAARPAVYSMGPTHSFNPVAGDEVNFISFANGITIDTRTAGPALPAGLATAETPGQADYWIVQFTGPFRTQWLDELKHVGVSAFGYLPNYAVMAKMTPEQRELVASLPMVRWTGLFQPAYKLQQELLSASGPHKVVILLMPGENSAAVDAAVRSCGGNVDDEMTSSFGTTITVSIDGACTPTLARLSEVAWMQEWTQASICNDNCQWVTQSGWRSTAPDDTSLAARPCWAHGVRGKGVITSQTDTGLNTGHDMFRDPNLSVTPPGIWPDHRKIVAYKNYEGADGVEGQYHGSHVAGTICGNDSVTGGTSYYDGMAKDARHYFVDVSNGYSFVLPSDLTALWDTVYLGRGLPDSIRPIKQHSGSWGYQDNNGTYLIQDASTDAYCWVHKDFMNIFAAGNEYWTKTLRNPGIAKNVLTIGADTNGTGSNGIADFSSRGPTQDNRIKPNITAPGVDLWSATNTGTNTYSQMSGTSMATPAANGTVALLRCYLMQGFYPTGSAVPADKLTYISSALLRSMAIASADPNVGSFTVPSSDIGWGRIDADSVLYFTGDLRKLIIIDDTMGIATGEYKERQFRVTSAIPLRVCLAWTDTAAAPNASPTLVNDLDLTLTAPGGTTYKGNEYTNGQSTPNPTGRDSINVEECARVNAPDTGLWTISVSAHNVKTAKKQSFAWTITGDVNPLAVQPNDVGAIAIIAPVDTVDTGTVVTPRAVVYNFGTMGETFRTRLTIGTGYTDTKTTNLGAGAADTLTFANWVANPAGTYAVRCTTELTGDDFPANDLAKDPVVVHRGAGIEEGKGLPSVFSLDQILPNPSSGRTSVRYGLPRLTTVNLSVYSTAGTLVRKIAAGVQNPGWYTTAWDGNDLRGRKVGTGVYLFRLEAGAFTSTRKLVIHR